MLVVGTREEEEQERGTVGRRTGQRLSGRLKRTEWRRAREKKQARGREVTRQKSDEEERKRSKSVR